MLGHGARVRGEVQAALDAAGDDEILGDLNLAEQGFQNLHLQGLRFRLGFRVAWIIIQAGHHGVQLLQIIRNLLKVVALHLHVPRRFRGRRELRDQFLPQRSRNSGLLHPTPSPLHTASHPSYRHPFLGYQLIKAIQNKTPYQLWTGHQPNIHHLRVFGCTLVPEETRKKSNLTQKRVLGVCSRNQRLPFTSPLKQINYNILQCNFSFCNMVTQTVEENPVTHSNSESLPSISVSIHALATDVCMGNGILYCPFDLPV